jgi:hypothetical protein
MTAQLSTPLHIATFVLDSATFFTHFTICILPTSFFFLRRFDNIFHIFRFHVALFCFHFFQRGRY